MDEDTGRVGPNKMQLDPSFNETKGFKELQNYAAEKFSENYRGKSYGDKFQDYKKSKKEYQKKINQLHRKRPYNHGRHPQTRDPNHKTNPAHSKVVIEAWEKSQK